MNKPVLLFWIFRAPICGALALITGVDGYLAVKVSEVFFLAFPALIIFTLIVTLHTGAMTRRDRRALKLLLASLTLSQRRRFLLRGRFEVKGSDGSVYQISNSFYYNVSSRGGYRYCAYPKGDLPRFDCLLAQKLLIESDVRYFKNRANPMRDYYG